MNNTRALRGDDKSVAFGGGKVRSESHTSAKLLSLLIPSVLALASCGGHGSGGGQPTAAPAPVQSPPSVQSSTSVESVAVSPSAITLVLGETQQLTATLHDVSGNSLVGPTVTWSSGQPMVATISASGAVTGVGAGSATITATSEGKSGSASTSVAVLQFVSVVTGGAHTCALTGGGIVYCWGRGESGQLGVATPRSSCALDGGVRPCESVPVAVGGGLTFTSITGGGAHMCALTSDGIAYCWGNNGNGQLGDNSVTLRDAPVPVATTLRFAMLDAGVSHTCGLTTGGTAYCWGLNSRGQLGDGTTANRSTPTAVIGGHTFQAIAAGGFSIGHTCGLTVGGAVYCWGDNERGQLGIGTSDLTQHSTPAPVSGGMVFTSLTAGLGRHTCGVTGVGNAYCWGENTFGGLGDGSDTNRSSPSAVAGGITFTRLVAGGFIGHTCGLAAAGVAYCWGENEVSAIGDGSTTDAFTPSPVAGGHAFDSIDAGFRHTCAGSMSGTVYCWGSGGAGQLGTGSTAQSHSPTKVVGQP